MFPKINNTWYKYPSTSGTHLLVQREHMYWYWGTAITCTLEHTPIGLVGTASTSSERTHLVGFFGGGSTGTRETHSRVLGDWGHQY